MGRIEDLNRINDFAVYDVKGEEFRSFGRIVPGLDAEEIIRYMEKRTAIPCDGNVYVASDPELEKMPIITVSRDTVFGGMDIQAGYCNGRNSTFNGFEYHKSPEVDIAVTDLALALGHSYDITDDPESGGLTYDSGSAKVFFVPKGTAIELFGMTLHLSPLRTLDSGFKCVVILPRGTNTPLTGEEKAAASEALNRGDKEARLLLQKHKWIIAHPERRQLTVQGAHPGVTGPNRELKF